MPESSLLYLWTLFYKNHIIFLWSLTKIFSNWLTKLGSLREFRNSICTELIFDGWWSHANFKWPWLYCTVRKFISTLVELVALSNWRSLTALWSSDKRDIINFRQRNIEPHEAASGHSNHTASVDASGRVGQKADKMERNWQQIGLPSGRWRWWRRVLVPGRHKMQQTHKKAESESL